MQNIQNSKSTPQGSPRVSMYQALAKKHEPPVKRQTLPPWIKATVRSGPNSARIRQLLKNSSLHTVCQEANCPNIGKCWEEGTATFMILGNRCTRNCSFCDVISAKPLGLDFGEPQRVADAVAELKLKQVVITTVTRDDLPDGGASIFARTIELLRKQDSEIKVEFLISDLGRKEESLKIILDSGVDVLGHNVETIGRFQSTIRGNASLNRSLWVLKYASEYKPRPIVKTGFMVGLGETFDEAVVLMHQIQEVGVDILTIGQYLSPSPYHHPVEKFYYPEEFKKLTEIGHQMGFGHIEAGPLVRSSYKAFSQSRDLLEKAC